VKPIRFLAVGILAACLLAAGGCGKKGDPTLPQKGFSAAVRALAGDWDGNFIVLHGAVEGLSSPAEARERVQGCRVYYGAYDPAEPPCEDCPVRYHGYHEFGVEVITADGFSCKVPGKVRDTLYFFKVHLIGPDGELGPPSNRTKVEAVAPGS